MAAAETAQAEAERARRLLGGLVDFGRGREICDRFLQRRHAGREIPGRRPGREARVLVGCVARVAVRLDENVDRGGAGRDGHYGDEQREVDREPPAGTAHGRAASGILLDLPEGLGCARAHSEPQTLRSLFDTCQPEKRLQID